MDSINTLNTPEALTNDDFDDIGLFSPLSAMDALGNIYNGGLDHTRSPGHESVASEYSIGDDSLNNTIDTGYSSPVLDAGLMDFDTDVDLLQYLSTQTGINMNDFSVKKEEDSEYSDPPSVSAASSLGDEQELSTVELLRQMANGEVNDLVQDDIGVPVQTFHTPVTRSKSSTTHKQPFETLQLSGKRLPVRHKKAKETDYNMKIDELEKLEHDLTVDKTRKNAIQAKINREKKKLYTSSLEHQLSVAVRENKELKSKNGELQELTDSLTDEVAYLKSVLANQSTLSKLLKNINTVQGVHLSTSFRKRSAELDHDYEAQSAKKAKKSSTTGSGGVCLHVHDENVSLEFCSTCSKMAKFGRSQKNQ